MKANQKFRDEQAVSDVVGSLLLVAITVLMVGALGVLIFSVAEPVDPIAADVTATLSQGNGGWGTGDEEIRLAHRGGERIDADRATIRIKIGNDQEEISGASQIGGAFSDGSLSIGETWVRLEDIPNGVDVTVVLIGEGRGGGSTVLAQVSAVADCSADAIPPFVDTWSLAPSDLRSDTVGNVVVTATVEDGCQNVLDTPVPALFFGFTDGFTPATFQQVALSPGAQPHQWVGTITGQTWSSQSGMFLELYLDPVTDAGSNSGESDHFQELVDDLASLTPPSGFTAHVGGLTAAEFAKLQSWTDGSSANLTEAPQTAPSQSTGPTKRDPATAPGNTVANDNDALLSDNVRATIEATTDIISVTGFTAPAGATSIISASMGFEGLREGPQSGNTVSVVLSALIGATPAGTPLTQSLTTTEMNYTTALPGVTLANVPSITLNLQGVQVSAGQRWAAIDHVWVELTYMAPGPSTYNMTIEIRFDSIGPGSSNSLQIVYQAGSIEDFRVEVQSTAGTFTARAPDMSLASPTSISIALNPSDIQTGPTIVRLRIVDLTTTNTAQGYLLLDYVRIRSV